MAQEEGLVVAAGCIGYPLSTLAGVLLVAWLCVVVLGWPQWLGSRERFRAAPECLGIGRRVHRARPEGGIR